MSDLQNPTPDQAPLTKAPLTSKSTNNIDNNTASSLIFTPNSYNMVNSSAQEPPEPNNAHDFIDKSKTSPFNTHFPSKQESNLNNEASI